MTQIVLNESSSGDVSRAIDKLLKGESTPNPNTPIVSRQVKEVFDIVNYVIISAAIGVFGIGSNVINITVFVKQGFRDVITISLFALAISDLFALIAMEVYDVFINPYFRSADLSFLPAETQYIMTLWPHSCFVRITCLVTAFVTLERCLCITFPLKIKTILTPARSAIAVFVIFMGVFISVIPAYMTVEVSWRFDSTRNRTILRVDNKNDVERIADIAFVINCIMQFIAFGSVVVSTAILVIKLKQQSIWRNSKSSASGNGENKPGTVSPKDRKLIRMVILISVILIFCCTPGSSCFITALIVPGFSPDGIYQNIYYVGWSFAFVTDAINPSVSIFIYYNMSSKYRSTFRRLFPVCFSSKQKSSADDSYTTSAHGSSAYTVNVNDDF